MMIFSKHYKILLIISGLFLVCGIFVYGAKELKAPAKTKITNFVECKAAGNKILEKYPSVCVLEDGTSFMEDISDKGYMCTMDAMMCPNGTYVGRSGPNCEFVCP